MGKHNWNAALRRAQAETPRAAEPGEIIVHPGQQPLLDASQDGTCYRQRKRYLAEKHCPLFDGEPAQQGGLFDE